MDEPLNDDNIKGIAKTFKGMIMYGDLPARGVRMLDTKHHQIVRAAAQKWMSQTRRRSQLSPLQFLT